MALPTSLTSVTGSLRAATRSPRPSCAASAESRCIEPARRPPTTYASSSAATVSATPSTVTAQNASRSESRIALSVSDT